MHNLIQYCLDVGPERFIKFKFERKNKVIRMVHFVSKKDVSKYDLYLYVYKDKYGRYKLRKYVSNNISCICEMLNNGLNSDTLTALVNNQLYCIDANLHKDTKRMMLLERFKKLKALNKLSQ